MMEDDVSLGVEQEELIGLNRIGLNRIGLNRIGLNRIGLNLIGLNLIGLNRIGLNQLELDPDDLDALADGLPHPIFRINFNTTACPAGAPTCEGCGCYAMSYNLRPIGGAMQARITPQASILTGVTADNLSNIGAKTLRCLNPVGVTGHVRINNSTVHSDQGDFGIGEMPLTHRQYVEALMACLGVFANDRSMEINATASFPHGGVVATSAECNSHNVPGITVGYHVTTRPGTGIGANADDVVLEGKWYFNASRHWRWDSTPHPQLRHCMSWMSSLGRHDAEGATDDTGRLCLDVAMDRLPMPPECGGDSAVRWQGKLRNTFGYAPAGFSNTVLCENNTSLRHEQGGSCNLDYNKGVNCGLTGNSDPNKPSTLFYADLPSNTFNDICWEAVTLNFGGGGGGGGS